MKSGLEDRNNARGPALPDCRDRVSMKSGLEDRNNPHTPQGLEVSQSLSQ